ncbi:MAG: tyrosine-type recombinase/integrase [Alphaproteobacteria bacterium]|nr:tyrosine-type recombinase/integrase [Alphaproteobacteria bacterium]
MSWKMQAKKPPYTHGFTDRYGKPRFYFRRPGYERVALPGTPWSEEFMNAYAVALSGPACPAGSGANSVRNEDFDTLAVRYYASAGYLQLAPATKTRYRIEIERLRRDYGPRAIVGLVRKEIVEMLGQRAAKPWAANNWLRLLKRLMKFAVEIGMRRDDPTAGVARIKVKSKGFPTWEEEHIAKYRECHPLGTKARLALELLLNTGQRRGDVLRMGRQHIRSGTLSIEQRKTGMLVQIPVMPELEAAIDAMAFEYPTFLTTDSGKPLSGNGFGKWFRNRADEAGIPKGYTAHGLRKANATRLAEAGCTEHELMAWGGWSTLAEVQRYTKAANRKRLAESAREKLEAKTSTGKPD